MYLKLIIVITSAIHTVCITEYLEFSKPYSPESSSVNSSCEYGKNLKCPKWSFCKEKQCQCPASLSDAIHCNPVNQGKNVLWVLKCYCVTYNSSENLFELGPCIYKCGMSYNKFSYYQMPVEIDEWNNFTCGLFHRSGTLCAKCEESRNLYSRAYSYDMTCIRCSGSYTELLKYILAAFAPLTVFCSLILFFRVNVYSSSMQGYVLYCQFYSIPALSRILFIDSMNNKLYLQLLKILTTVYGVWNLDFFRMFYSGFCLPIGSLSVLALDFAIAMYPMLLVSLTYILIKLYDQKFTPLLILWKPLGAILRKLQAKRRLQSSIIDSFSSFFFLSNMKLLSVCFDLLIPVRIHQFRNPNHLHSSLRLFYDTSIPYFQGAHTYYGIFAIATLILFVSLPVLLLLLYPFKPFASILSKCPNRIHIFLYTFVDSFHGQYKNGTQPGTRDYRWFSAIILICRFVFLLIYLITLNSLFFSLAAIVFTLLAITIITVDPFKEEFQKHSFILAYFMLLAAMSALSLSWLCLITDKNLIISENIIFPVLILDVLAPTISMIIIMMHWIYKFRKFGTSTFGSKSCSNFQYNTH